MFGCETCGGSGEIEGAAAFARVSVADALASDGSSRDPYVRDAVLPFGWDVSRRELARERDGQIGRLGEQLRPPLSEAELLAEANARPDEWERVRRRMYRLFDYAALDRALGQLREADDVACRALHAVYVYGWLELERAPVVVLERGLVFVEVRLPDPLRAPPPPPDPVNVVARGRVDRRALEQRDESIRRSIMVGGEPTVRVAARFGLSVAQVNRVVAAGAVR